MSAQDPLEIIKGMRGVREAFYLDETIMKRVKAEEDTVTSPGTGTAVKNLGVEEALKRKKVICIIKDPRFRPPPEPTVILKCSDGQVLGVEVFPNTQDQYIGKEGCLMVSDGFVIFYNVIPTEGSSEAFIMPPVSFPRTERGQRLQERRIVQPRTHQRQDDQGVHGLPGRREACDHPGRVRPGLISQTSA